MNIVLLFLVLLGAIAVTAVAQRKDLQPALIIVVVGFGVSFIPGLPRLNVPSELILGVVLPPLLYSAALNFSIFSFLKNLRPIVGLGVSLVVITAIAVGFVSAWIVPSLALGTAILLGAVVSPPDAVTAVAIGRKLGLPRRVMDVLTGESLVNDAAALTLFTITVSAIAGTHTIFSNPVLLFLYAAFVGAILGIVLGTITNIIRRYLKNAGLETVLGIMLPFAAYFIAEQFEASGVLAVVFAAFAVGAANDRVGYQTRLQEKQVWSSLDVILEAFVFAYMGLQLRFVISDVAESSISAPLAFAVGGVVLVLVLVIRPVFVFIMFAQGTLGHKRHERRRAHSPRYQRKLTREAAFREKHNQPDRAVALPMTAKEATVVSWTGMRGVVTIAAAAGIPLVTANGHDFPARALIQVVAFTVAVGTLLIQGATLPALIRRVKLPSDRAQQRVDAEKVAAVADSASKQVLSDFAANPPAGLGPAMLEQLRVVMERRTAEAASEQSEDFRDSAFFDTYLQRSLQAQRLAVVQQRDRGLLDADAVFNLIERLDYQQAAIAVRQANRL
jgi:Na+/H+ antiporter